MTNPSEVVSRKPALDWGVVEGMNPVADCVLCPRWKGLSQLITGEGSMGAMELVSPDGDRIEPQNLMRVVRCQVNVVMRDISGVSCQL